MSASEPPPPRWLLNRGLSWEDWGGPGRSEQASAPSAVSRVRTSVGSSAVFRPVPARASATGFQFVCVLSCWQFPPVFHQQDSGFAEVSERASFSPHGSGMASRRACSAHTAFCVFPHLRLWEPNISSSGQQPCDPRPTRNNAAVQRARRAARRCGLRSETELLAFQWLQTRRHLEGACDGCRRTAHSSHGAVE